MSSFCVYVIFSETIRARAMILESCIHLEELRSTVCSILSLDLLFSPPERAQDELLGYRDVRRTCGRPGRPRCTRRPFVSQLFSLCTL